MINYTKRCNNSICFCISLVIFSLINLFVLEKKETIKLLNKFCVKNEKIETIQNIVSEESQKMILKTEQEQITVSDEKNLWQIEIPKIELLAPIEEGTTKEIMDEYVGHFEKTSKWKGNIGLVAHNRGYPKNYFQFIKSLSIGDKIIYYIGNYKKTYEIDEITIIKDTDWSYLKDTIENRITLITCVENDPNHRRCIQGKEN